MLLTLSSFFFFNDTATTEIYTLSLHDALPIYPAGRHERFALPAQRRQSSARNHALYPDRQNHVGYEPHEVQHPGVDRKSTRLNSSHGYISYAVFCLKKKKKTLTRATLYPRTRH